MIARRGTKRESGFTLIELLVVIVIIGLAAGIVVLTMPDPGGSLPAEAERFAARAKAARDAAILESRPMAVAVGPGGYEISRRRDGAWQSVDRHDWAEGTEVRVSGGTGGSIRFDSTGIAEPAEIVLTRRERHVAVRVGEDGDVALAR